MPNLHPHLTEHTDDVWRTICRLLGDSEDARECFQQTFLDALNLEPATVGSWRAVLCQIATRRAMDLLRRRYRDRDSTGLLESDPLDNEGPPESELAFQELRQAVREILATTTQGGSSRLKTGSWLARWFAGFTERSAEGLSCVSHCRRWRITCGLAPQGS